MHYIKLFLGVQVENDNILVFEEESSSFPISKVLLHQNAVVTVCSNTVKYEAVCIRLCQLNSLNLSKKSFNYYVFYTEYYANCYIY